MCDRDAERDFTHSQTRAERVLFRDPVKFSFSRLALEIRRHSLRWIGKRIDEDERKSEPRNVGTLSDNARLFSMATAFTRFAGPREINDGLLALRFAPFQRIWVLTGLRVAGVEQRRPLPLGAMLMPDGCRVRAV